MYFIPKSSLFTLTKLEGPRSDLFLASPWKWNRLTVGNATEQVEIVLVLPSLPNPFPYLLRTHFFLLVSFFLLIFFLFVCVCVGGGTGFELRASHLQTRHLTNQTTHPVYFAPVIFEMGSHKLFARVVLKPQSSPSQSPK
jgi:hypothetical protein